MDKGATFLTIAALVVVAAIGIGVAVLFFGQMSQPPSPASTETGNSNQPAGSVKGEVFFGVTDAAITMENVSSVFVTVNALKVHNQQKNWVDVAVEPRRYDLLALKAAGEISLFAKADLDAGVYDQVRLSISQVAVVEDNVEKEAKLPSGDLKLFGDIVVEEGKQTSVVLDFIASESLHVAGNGKIIFAPVVSLETRSSATVEVDSRNRVTVNGGRVRAKVKMGMDVSGEFKPNFAIDPKTKLDLIGNNIIKVTKDDEATSSLAVNASSAANTAVTNDYLDVALAVELVTRNSQKVWQVMGLKDLATVAVYIDATTGAKVE